MEVLEPTLFRGHPLDAIVTTRHGGVSVGSYASLNLGLHVDDDRAAVLENRRCAARAVGLDLGDLVFCKQVHQPSVAVVTDHDRGRGSTTQDDAFDAIDALVTRSPGIGLVVMVADCVPIVLYDPVAHVLGCVHAGWGGTVRLVSEAAVKEMGGLGSDPSDILAAIGPAIEPDRYQVGDNVVDEAREAFGAAADAFLRPDGTGRWLFDLWTANRQTLLGCGLRPENIATASVGTGDDRFFSDRLTRPCGRFAAIAVLRDRA
jgi:YfiH family protein